jgi:hypothetical protein
MNFSRALLIAVISSLSFVGCKKDDGQEVPSPTPPAATGPKLVFKFQFDDNQVRLDNLGNPSTIPAGHAAQTPVFHKIGAHYLEMTNGPLVPLGGGEIIYTAPETNAGGANAIDFSQEIIVSEGETFYEIPLSQITPDTYEWMRVSLAYQNYDIDFRYQTFDLTGRLASFVGFNTYIDSYTIQSSSIDVNGNRLQGYWGLEVATPFGVTTQSGQSPAGATTVPNPLSATSPIPAGSCVVTGAFAQPLVITGNETEDIVITLSLSSNQSFEWQDGNGNGIFEPGLPEAVVDMGLRGLIPIVEN